MSPSDGFAFSFCETEEEWEEEKEWMGDFESEIEDADDLDEDEIDVGSESYRDELVSGQAFPTNSRVFGRRQACSMKDRKRIPLTLRY